MIIVFEIRDSNEILIFRLVHNVCHVGRWDVHRYVKYVLYTQCITQSTLYFKPGIASQAHPSCKNLTHLFLSMPKPVYIYLIKYWLWNLNVLDHFLFYFSLPILYGKWNAFINIPINLSCY